MNASRQPLIVVEDDPFPRLLQAFLADRDDTERTAAIADFLAHDVPDYGRWLADARARAPGVWPARVVAAATQDELGAALREADAVVVESLRIGADEVAAAPRLKAVQKYGTVMRNIDVAACAARGVAVFTLRRRANIACAEHAFALLLALARKLRDTAGRVSVPDLEAAGYAPRFFDTRHTPNSNWARIGGLRTLYGTTAGILGLGEIGREIALRATAFGMRVLYHQRTRLSADEERVWQAEYRPLDDLLASSDAVFVALPLNAATRGLIGGRELARMKRGALLINVSRAAIVDRAALLEAVDSGALGGLGLDSFYDEPGAPGDPLARHPAALVTPRIAAQPRHNALADLAVVMENLSRALSRP